MITTIKKQKRQRISPLISQFNERPQINVVTGKNLSDSLDKENLPCDNLLTHPEKSLSLTERLNAMIIAGVSFKVSTDDFQTCGGNNLSEAEKDFLTNNKIYVLCLLQQGLLMKYLPKNLIPDYIFEVNERLAITADGGEAISTEYFEIVRDVTREWFSDMLDAMPDPVTTI